MNRQICIILTLFLSATTAQAGPVLDMVVRRQLDNIQRTGSSEPITIKYGEHEKQQFDLFLPRHPTQSPVILFIDDENWKRENRTLPTAITDYKEIYWVNKGYIYIRVNYRPYPDVNPYEQAQDIGRSIAKIQNIISQYNGDANKLIVMGYSTGAYLTALISSNPAIMYEQGAKKWQASIILDSNTLDIKETMRKRNTRNNHNPFGDDPNFWTKISPIENITPNAIPMLLVCSLRRLDNSCDQSNDFAYQLKKNQIEAEILHENLTHGQITTQLGQINIYTNNVDNYIERQLRY